MESNSMSNNLQWAYKKFHSTESAVSKVENDVLLNMEQSRVTALTLLDLSAAFDTIDHLTLISRLSSCYRISGTALDLFTSYLSNRCQQVKIHDYISEAVYIYFGVPQGSVLGPILFTLYTAPLSHVIAEHDVEHHLYADDTKIYISLSGSEALESLTDLKFLCYWCFYLDDKFEAKAKSKKKTKRKVQRYILYIITWPWPTS